MCDRQKQVKHQFFHPLTWKRRIWSQSRDTFTTHCSKAHMLSFQLRAAPVFPTGQEDFPTLPLPTWYPLCSAGCICVCFCFQRANHSSALGVFQHVLRTSCTEESFSFAPDALTTKGPILKSHVNGSLPEAFVHTVSRILSCSSSL